MSLAAFAASSFAAAPSAAGTDRSRNPAADPGRPTVYLTFDDGPALDTPALLSVLARHRVQATFFPIGRPMPLRPSVMNDIIAAGHGVGNHTETHPHLWLVPDHRIRTELAQWETRMEAFAPGWEATCYRPPYGATDRRVRSVARQEGYQEILWDTDTSDWAAGIWPHVTEDHIYRRLDAATDGSIVLMHDGPGNRGRTVRALDRWLRDNRRDFDFGIAPGCTTPRGGNREIRRGIIVIGDSACVRAENRTRLSARIDETRSYVSMICEHDLGPFTAARWVAAGPPVPRVAYILLGTDWDGPTRRFTAGTRALVRSLRDRGAVRVTVLTAAGTTPGIEQRNRALRRLATRHARLDDWADVANRRSRWLHADGSGLSRRGVHKLADHLVEASSPPAARPDRPRRDRG